MCPSFVLQCETPGLLTVIAGRTACGAAAPGAGPTTYPPMLAYCSTGSRRYRRGASSPMPMRKAMMTCRRYRRVTTCPMRGCMQIWTAACSKVAQWGSDAGCTPWPKAWNHVRMSYIHTVHLLTPMPDSPVVQLLPTDLPLWRCLVYLRLQQGAAFSLASCQTAWSQPQGSRMRRMAMARMKAAPCTEKAWHVAYRGMLFTEHLAGGRLKFQRR